MYIYNIKQNKNALCNHILDPDYYYTSNIEEDILKDFFKQIILPESIEYLVGIYIKYEIKDMPYEKHTIMYEKFSKPLEDKIITYLDFGNANLFNHNSNHFFLVLFDTEEAHLLSSLINFTEDIQKRNFIYREKQCQFSIKIGVYFTYPYINALQFYYKSKEQYDNVLHNENTFISIKPL